MDKYAASVRKDSGTLPLHFWGWEKGGESNAEEMGEIKSGGDAVDFLFSPYSKLDKMTREDSDSRASGTKMTGGGSSVDEATSGVNDSWSSMHRTGVPSLPEEREGIQRTIRHYSYEFGNDKVTASEIKIIMADEKLAEMALSDPKRAKRILANRQFPAASKELRMRYVTELANRVRYLTELDNSVFSFEPLVLTFRIPAPLAELTLLQRDSAGLTNLNDELKFHFHAMLGGHLTNLGIVNRPGLAGAVFDDFGLHSHCYEFDHCEELDKSSTNMNHDYYGKEAYHSSNGMNMHSARQVSIDMPKEEDCHSKSAAARDSWALSVPVMQVVGQAAGAALSQAMTNDTLGCAPWLNVLVKTASLVGFGCTFASVGFMCHDRVINRKLLRATAKVGAIATAAAVILRMGMPLPTALALPLGMAAFVLVVAAVASA